MKNLLLLFSFLTILNFSKAQNNSYTSSTQLTASCSSCVVFEETFNSYAGNQTINSLFNGLAVFQGTAPTTFGGGWRDNCASNEFLSRALIPEPRFQGNALVVSFSQPVVGVGAHVYDDHDGTPMVNTISLTLITVLGDTIVVSETCNEIGEAGFLGGSSSDGIITAIWQIDNNDGNLEIDNFIVLSSPVVLEEENPNSKKELPIVSLSPNPAHQFLNISTSKSKITKVIVYNYMGNILLSSDNKKAEKIKLDVSSLADGNYTAVVRFKNNCLKMQKVNFIKN